MTQDDINKFFDSLTHEELLEKWKKYNILENNVGVTVNDFLEFNKNNNSNWKPNVVKTGFCNFQKCPFTHYCFMNNEKITCNICGNLVGGYLVNSIEINQNQFKELIENKYLEIESVSKIKLRIDDYDEFEYDEDDEDLIHIQISKNSLEKLINNNFYKCDEFKIFVL